MEKQMTNREMIMVIKNSESSLEHIKEVAEKIVANTYDRRIEYVNYVYVKEYDIVVSYHYTYGSRWHKCEIELPIEWFDEEFDYVKAYKNILRKEAANRKRKAGNRKKAKELKEKKEYKTYLKLKKKYENGETDD